MLRVPIKDILIAPAWSIQVLLLLAGLRALGVYARVCASLCTDPLTRTPFCMLQAFKGALI
jgi:hypothetical protein